MTTRKGGGPHASPVTDDAQRAKPRDWATPTANFGYPRRIVWHEATTDEQRAALKAARFQHGVARRIRQEQDYLGLEDLHLAARIGVSVPHLQKLLRGGTSLTLDRMFQLTTAVQLTLIPNWAGPSDEALEDDQSL